METHTDTHIIDATGKPIGRIASQVAHLLQGKHRTDVARNIAHPTQVTVSNVSKMYITDKKRVQTEYDRYSGYPGGRKVLSMEKLIARSGYSEVLRKAVYGMLPSNKLRAPRMKKLSITE